MGLLHTLNKHIFRQIHTNHLVYNTCWEDPRCDRQLLRLQPDSRVVMLTSAGCNALEYLLDDVQAIYCVDVNPRQNALLQFKIALLHGADHATLFRFFGQGWHPDAYTVFRECVLPRLPDGFARQWWPNFLHAFSGRGLRRSFYWHGSSGTVAWLVQQWLRAHPSAWAAAERLFSAQTLEEQAYHYDQLEPKFFTPLLTWMLRQHLFQSMLGVPKSQQIMAAQNYPNGMAGYFAECLRKVLRLLPIQDNYFWKLYFYGHYVADCCPNYLRPEYFDILKHRSTKVRTYTSTLSQFLRQHPGQYTHFVLLDHQDWMAQDPALHFALAEEWQLILANAAPGARVLLRSAAREITFIPPFAQERIAFDTHAAQRAHDQDRVGTYASTWVGQICA